MREVVAVLVFLLLIVPAAAEENIFDEGLYQAKVIEMLVSIDGGVQIDGSADEVTMQLLQTPVQTQYQSVDDVGTEPQSRYQDETYTFTWNNPSQYVEASYRARVIKKNQPPVIAEQVKFPYQDIPNEYAQYLRSEKIIQITPEIRQLAHEIIGDENDATRAAFKLASWTKDNIEYDLTSVTAEAAQTSQWVLEQRRGVCDELTSLFIAMARSQGIPARFVSGIAYTNLEELDTNWGPHGWAELWFPGYGWIPYDVTYGQFGWLDATHIRLDSQADATSSSARYTAKGQQRSIEPTPLSTSVEVLRQEGSNPLSAQIEAETALERVGPNSYNRVDVTLTNPNDVYLPTEIYMSRTTGLQTQDYTQTVLLPPKSSTQRSYLTQVQQTLEQGFTYTFPIVVSTNTGQRVETEFKADIRGPILEREDLEVEEQARASAIKITCQSPSSVIEGVEATITCDAPGSRICIEETCQQDKLTYNQVFEQAGAYTLLAKATKGEDQQQQIITLIVEDYAELSLQIRAPEIIRPGQPGSVVAEITRTSFSEPKSIKVYANHYLFKQEWDLEQIPSTATLELQVPFDALHTGENTITWTVDYNTGLGREEKQASITLEGEPANFPDRMTLWVNNLRKWLT